MAGYTFIYECPVCFSTRILRNVPDVHRDSAAPLCWDHSVEVRMVRT